MESVWYYARGGAQTGPVSFGDLKAAVATGQLGAEDLVWKEGTADWVAARTIAGLIGTPPAASPAPAATPPIPPQRTPAAPFPPRSAVRGALEPLPLADEATPAPVPAAGQSSEIVEMAKVFIRRTAAANPSIIVPTRDEESLLAQAGYDPVARKFVVWRRAVLWVSVAPTAVAGLFALISLLDMETYDKSMLSPFGTLLLFLQVFAICVLPFVAVFAALGYDRLSKSTRLVLIGGLVSIGVPLLVAFAPASWQVDPKPGEFESAEAVQMRKVVYARTLGAKYALLLLPMVLSFLPAISWACVRVKGFLPESLVPGWSLAAGLPVFVLLTLVTCIPTYHVVSNLLLLLGLILWIGAPLLFLSRFKLLTRPVGDSRELAAFTKTQLYVLATIVIGILIVVLYMLMAKQGEGTLLGTSKKDALRIWSLELHKTWLEYVGRSLFMVVMFADLLVRIAVIAWREERAFASTGPAASFDRKMSGIGEAIEVKGIPPVA